MQLTRNPHATVSIALALTLLSTAAWVQTPAGDAVLRARETALVAGDAAAVLRLFADDAVVATSSGRLLIGKDQIKSWVDDQVNRHQREEAGTRQLQGNKLTWVGKVYRDDWQTLGVSPLEVRQDAIVEGGKIKFFNTTFVSESAERLEKARKNLAGARGGA